jgi:putative membrane protein
MPSEHRLHPSSILFALAGILRAFALPFLLLVITGVGGSSDRLDGWQIWMLFVLVFGVGSAVLRYLTFRLTYEGDELVVRSGILFRNERHVPYHRIQNLDATRGVVHRLFGVAEVSVETGSGQKPEARISVLRESQFEEMRRRVFEGRTSPGEPPDTHETSDTLLHLPPLELLLLGLLDNRGFLFIAAAYGAVWESGLQGVIWDRLSAHLAAPGAVSSIWYGLKAGQAPSFWLLAFMAAGLLGLVVVIRVLSMVWVSATLHDFRLTGAGEDLRTEYGLFTRVTTTVPRRRIQSLTVVATPLQRLCGRASIHVATAGSTAGAEAVASRPRERLAPIIRAADVTALVRHVLPTADIDSFAWQPLHPRAASRASKPLLALHTAIAVGLLAVDPRFWPVPLAYLAICALPTVAVTRQHVRHIAWALDEHVVAVRSGWLWRSVTVAPVAKIQSVTATESPFDRRAIMAALAIDTAGGAVALPRLRIPYLPRDTAMALMASLSTKAAHTTFRW